MSIIRSTYAHDYIARAGRTVANDDQSAPEGRAGEIALTPGQKLALLVMRGSDLSKQVLAGVLEKTKAGPSGRDFYTCAMLGLAINKGRYHVLSPPGRWRADQVVREVARQYGLHIVAYGLGGPGRAAFARCSCGFSSFRSRAIPSYLTLIRQDATRHLLLESARQVSL